MNAAYLETPTSTHVVIWAQHQPYQKDNGRRAYTSEVVTLCGRKKQFLKRPKLRYPDYSGGDPQTPQPLCKMCEHVLAEASDLTKQLVGS